MNRSLLAATQKARIWQDDDGTVVKKYFDAERARGEHERTLQIETRFGTSTTIEGWTYGVARILSYDGSREIRMEFAPGITVARAAADDPSVVRHLGRWLGLYHTRTVDQDSRVPIYSDVSVHNFLVDPSRATVTAIDPGLAAGQRSLKEIDLFMGVASIASLAVKLRIRPGPMVTHYLRGYRSNGPKPDLSGEVLKASATKVLAHYRDKASHHRGLRLVEAKSRLVLLRWYLRHAVPRINHSLEGGS